MQMLFQRFDQIEVLQPELKDYILSVLRRGEVKKKHYFLRAGEIPRYIYFIERGLMRCWQIVDDKESTRWIMKEGDFVMSIVGFPTQTASNDNIVAQEDCIVHYITYDELQYACMQYRLFCLHRVLLVESYYQRSEKRHEMRHGPAHLSFTYFMAHESDLLGRVPDKHLASYLNMSKATFAHEKSEYFKRKS